MTSHVHQLRQALRARLAERRRVVGTFVKLADPDVVELCAAAGFDFVVVDLEHATLGERDALALVRHADACGIAALVRVPRVDAALANRLLESGAAGIQLSMLSTLAQAAQLRAAVRFAPDGARSMSLANRVAEYGASTVAELLRREAESPPLLVGQLETADTEPLAQLLPGLDVCFVGSTDLSVDLGVGPDSPELRAAVARIAAAAGAARVGFGGWAPSVAAADARGLAAAGYLVVGSDLQLLAGALRTAAADRDFDPARDAAAPEARAQKGQSGDSDD